MAEMTGYGLQKQFYEWLAETDEPVTPAHIALYHYIIQLCNRLGWKNPMDIDTPTGMLCSKIGTGRTYKATLIDLHLFGLVEILYWTKNQHRAHRIRLNPEILPCVDINLSIFDTIEMSKLTPQLDKIAKIDYAKKHKQSISKAKAEHKQSISRAGYSKRNKQDKPSKLKKLSQTDERNFLEILDNEEGNITPLNTPKNQGKEKGAGGGDLKTDILNYFLGMGWTAELAEKYYQTYSATNWTYNGEAITNWRAFAKGFVDKQPSQPKQLISQTYRGIEPPPNFW
jgi:hypothetical protein